MQRYEVIESHLLLAMLQARKRYQKVVEGGAGIGDFAYAAESDAICSGPENKDALEGAYKSALRQFHDFVLKRTAPEDLPIIGLRSSPESELLSESNSNHDRLRTKATTDELLIEEIGFDMLSQFLGSQPALDRRVELRNRRSEQRIDAQRSPALLSDGERSRVPIVILDVSRGGLGISTEIQLQTDDTVLIELNDHYKIVGKVKYCRTSNSGVRYSAGIQISKIRTDQGREI